MGIFILIGIFWCLVSFAEWMQILDNLAASALAGIFVSYAWETPFFASRNEVGFSQDFADQFYLYRLFDFRKDPKSYQLRGAIQSHCRLDPVSYFCHLA